MRFRFALSFGRMCRTRKTGIRLDKTGPRKTKDCPQDERCLKTPRRGCGFADAPWWVNSRYLITLLSELTAGCPRVHGGSTDGLGDCRTGPALLWSGCSKGRPRADWSSSPFSSTSQNAFDLAASRPWATSKRHPCAGHLLRVPH